MCGIYCDGSSTIEVSECVIAENLAKQTGGGIHVFSKWAARRDNTLYNYAGIKQTKKGEAFMYLWKFPFFNLSNSIIWGNRTNGDNAEFAGAGGRITIRSCNIRDGLEGIGPPPVGPGGNWLTYVGNIDTDPLFVDADRGDYRLRENSPASGMGVQSSYVRDALSVTSVGKRLVMWADIKRK